MSLYPYRIEINDVEVLSGHVQHITGKTDTTTFQMSPRTFVYEIDALVEAVVIGGVTVPVNRQAVSFVADRLVLEVGDSK